MGDFAPDFLSQCTHLQLAQPLSRTVLSDNVVNASVEGFILNDLQSQLSEHSLVFVIPGLGLWFPVDQEIVLQRSQD